MCLEPPFEPLAVDDDPGMPAARNRPGVVGGMDREPDFHPVHRLDSRPHADRGAKRSRRTMFYVDRSADRSLSRREEFVDHLHRDLFHQSDQGRAGEDGEPVVSVDVGGLGGVDAELDLAFSADQFFGYRHSAP